MAKAGERVDITTKNKDKYQGVLMPKTELIKSDAVVIKLDSGYNIGIDKNRIKKIRVLSKSKKFHSNAKKQTFDKNLPTVSILSTGGTISSKVDYKTGGVYTALTAADFVEIESRISKFANIKARQIAQIMSEDMNPQYWIKIAKEVYKELNKKEISGVVITHGTDTMHYTAAMLSFMLPKLTKPVVLVGSQRSTDRGSSDTFINLICAVIAATQKVGEVTVCMHATEDDNYCFLHRGTKVRKMHTSRRDAFRSVNKLPIARVWPEGKIDFVSEYKLPETKNELNIKIDSKVALIYVYPGMNPKIIDYYIKQKYHGIVLMAMALGHVPTNVKGYSIIQNIRNAVKKRIPVCITSQSLYGRVHPFVYSNLRRVEDTGAIFCEDMLAETAYAKLMHVLGKTKKMDEIKTLMQKNLAGEINPCIDSKMFLV